MVGPLKGRGIDGEAFFQLGFDLLQLAALLWLTVLKLVGSDFLVIDEANQKLSITETGVKINPVSYTHLTLPTKA